MKSLPYLRFAGLAWGLLVLPLEAAEPAAAEFSPVFLTESLRQEHPRLLADQADFDKLREAIRGGREPQSGWHATLRKDAEEMLGQPPSQYEIPDGKRLLATSRRVLDRVQTLAFIHRIDGGEEFLERAWRELEAAAAFKDWNPSHFLDTAEMTAAFAIGYDWLHGSLAPQRREVLREAMLKHGLRPGADAYSGRAKQMFVRAHHNWNQVCNSGLALGALAIADEEPEIAAEILKGALASLPRAMAEYAPDGGYPEGPSYWSYGTFYNVLMLDALGSALGTDFGLSGAEGFDRTAAFPVLTRGPGGETFNFADARQSNPSAREAATLMWLGARFGLADAVAAAEAMPPSAFSLLWYPGKPAMAPDREGPAAHYWRGPEVVVLEGPRDRADRAWLATKAGRPADNHAQADLGSFVFDLQGVRWAIDLGPDNYNLPGYFDRGSGRWKFFRNRAESHNTLVIAPSAESDQSLKADCKFVGTGGDRSPFAVADLTAAYGHAAERVYRGFRLIGSGADLLIQDEIELEKPADVLWLWHTDAETSVDGASATLRKNGKTLQVRIVEPADATFTARRAAPLPDSPTVEGQAENPGVTALTIRLEGFSGGRIRVLASPSDKESEVESIALEAWR